MKVKEIMNINPIVISSETPIVEIEKIFKTYKIWSVFIGDSQKFIGIITPRDLKFRGGNKNPSTPVNAIMSKNIISIDQEEDVISAISILNKQNINGLAVTKNGNPCGIITRYDIKNRYSRNVFDRERTTNQSYITHPLKPDISYSNQEAQTQKNIITNEEGFLVRLKTALFNHLNENFFSPLKKSYYEDPIVFLGLLSFSIGFLCMLILGVFLSIFFLFFQKQIISGSEPIPIVLLIYFLGGAGLLTIVGLVIVNSKKLKSPSYYAINRPQSDTGDGFDEYKPIFSHQFQIALSFSGKYRSLVEGIAYGLTDKFGKDTVFYDFFYKAHLARLDLDLLLQKIYKDNSELNVVFISSDYESKEWCGIEFRAIRELIKKRQTEKIMLLKLTDKDIEGIFSFDGFLDIRNMETSEIVDLIIQRYRGIPIGKNEFPIDVLIERPDDQIQNFGREHASSEAYRQTKKPKPDSTRSISDITRFTRRLR